MAYIPDWNHGITQQVRVAFKTSQNDVKFHPPPPKKKGCVLHILIHFNFLGFDSQMSLQFRIYCLLESTSRCNALSTSHSNFGGIFFTVHLFQVGGVLNHLDIVMRVSLHLASQHMLLMFSPVRFFVPDSIWLIDVTITNCTIKVVSIGDADTCIQGFGLQADSLPFPMDVNISNDGSFVYSQPQPRIETYYYILVVASYEITFIITVNMKGKSLGVHPRLSP